MTTDLATTIDRVCARIAPTWPLDRFIAVNPLWGLVDRPLRDVAAALRARQGADLLMPRAWFRDEYRAGRLRDADLAAALAHEGSPLALRDLAALLAEDAPPPRVRARVVDVADDGRDPARLPSWRAFVVHSISQFCAAHFDDGQAATPPARPPGLYAAWRERMRVDRSAEVQLGLRGTRALAAELPATARALVADALAALGVAADQREDYLWCLLLDQHGWAAWCAYRRFVARLAGRDDDAIVDLLAIRLAWEWIVARGQGAGFTARWQAAMASWPQIDAREAAARRDDWLLQRAAEHAWQRPVIAALAASPVPPAAARAPAAVQAVFCIDVRSEVYRRALEAAAPAVQTLGFAGFFGLPIAYAPGGTATSRPQLPGLLAPRLQASDAAISAEAMRERARNLDLRALWSSFKTDALSAFTFVEALGLTYATELAGETLGVHAATAGDRAGWSPAAEARRRARLAGTAAGAALDTEAKAELAAAMLRGMCLAHDLARLVLLVGHGSSSRNNPHAAGLDCGACCGQSGEVNARVAAALLNEPAVRAALRARGIAVPDETVFVGALHDTTTDEVTLFELDEVPASHRADVARVQTWLAAAGQRARAERAPALGIAETDPERLRTAVLRHARDWAQVRPEWGLANNAAFIIAPRERTRGVDLGGRAFLHEYRADADPAFAQLAQILTAPMVVGHWINFQYYASTVDNEHYGSGNKLLHNVVGGHLGVFEGNGGDLRIGLAKQSLHDGTRWRHAPLRLAVFVEAPRPAIDAILAAHASVRNLVTNGWIHLLQLEGTAVHARRAGAWVEVTAER